MVLSIPSHFVITFVFLCSNKVRNLFQHILFLMVCIGPLMSYAQDVHYSQFYLSPLTTNPSNTGNFAGDWRLAGNFRNQWRSLGRPFVSTSFSYDQNFYVYNEQLSGGLMFLHDESGLVNLRLEKVMASIAYHKKYGIHAFHLGFQPGYAIKAADLAGVSLPDQYDRNTGGFNSELSTKDPYAQNQLSYFDFNAGIGYGINLGKAKPEIGFSMFHLTNPPETFYGNDNKLPVRYMFTAKSEIEVLDFLSVMPYVLYMEHKKASEMVIGVNGIIHLPENNSNATGIYGGIMFRNGINRNTDAAIAVAGVRYAHLEIGVNYDFNVSELKLATDNKGAFEISLVYTSLSTLLKKTAIPCDRY